MIAPKCSSLLASLFLCACAKELPATDGVVHLDLELADGSSSATLLAGSEVRWLEQLDIAGLTSDLGPWRAEHCRVDPAQDGQRGIALFGNVQQGTRMQRVELRSSASYAASEIDFVELELARTTSGLARVVWKSSQDDPEKLLSTRSTTGVVHGGTGSEKVRIAVSTQPGWGGEITELAIVPKEEGSQRFELRAIRLGRVGFLRGPDPLEPGQGKDGGLIALGRDMRRAWPSDWNVPLFARARVPKGGVLSVDAGVSSNTTNVTAEVRFRVDARSDAAEKWRPIGSTAIVPGMRAQGPAWEHLSLPLAEYAGRDVQLRFLADEQGEPREGGKLERARLYWGEPLIVGERPVEGRPDVVLITLDTVRADAIGALRGGKEPSPTPFIDSLAARGMLFENAWTACNATSPSHASLMTGLAVQDHGLVDNRSLLAPVNATLAESFRAAGWQTAAAVSVPHLNPARSGLGQGFDRFFKGRPDSADDGEKTISAVKEWLGGFALEGSRPTFLWVHLFDAHAPYDVPPAFLDAYAKRIGKKVPPKAAKPRSLPEGRFDLPGEFLAGVSNRDWAEFMYRAAVAYDDELLRQLFEELEQRGGMRNALVALVADHGEALGEHANFYHHSGLYREVMHVPLILVPPASAKSPRGVRVREPVWSLDLARTLFGLTGGAIPPEVRGSDLLQLTEPRPARRIFFEHSNLEQVGCTDSEHSAIYTVVEFQQFGRDRKRAAGSLELFDCTADPAQARDVHREQPEAAKRYRTLFSEWRAHALNRTTLGCELTDEDELRLRQLGY
ncbi:MAG TPA: sulfatase [Planctomycetota bacterium]|nr:sulfatase [Planctomycetota bacterium]